MTDLKDDERYANRAFTVEPTEHHQMLSLKIFNEAGIITEMFLDMSQTLGLQAALKWASDQSAMKDRNR